MTSMIEKVARAMLADELKSTSKRSFEPVWAEESACWLANARAALTALLEPDEAMVSEAAATFWLNSGAMVSEVAMRLAIRDAMLAALASQEA